MIAARTYLQRRETVEGLENFGWKRLETVAAQVALEQKPADQEGQRGR